MLDMPTAPAHRPTPAAGFGPELSHATTAAQAGLLPVLRRAGLGSLIAQGHGLCLLAPVAADWLRVDHDFRRPPCSDADLRATLFDHLLDMPAGGSRLQPRGAALLALEEDAEGLRLVDACGRIVRAAGPAYHLGALRVQPITSPLQRPMRSLLEHLEAEPDLSDCAEAVSRSGLAPLLRHADSLTLFAPTNLAFQGLALRLGIQRRSLLADPGLLATVLRHHLVQGGLRSAALPWGSELQSLLGQSLRLSPLGLLSDGEVAEALRPGGEKPARNGVLHAIDVALLPHFHPS